jgi:hypothetical protein
MTARKARKSDNSYHTVGTYVCGDLACSLYVREKRRAQPGGYPRETLTVEEKVARTRANLAAFLDKIL